MTHMPGGRCKSFADQDKLVPVRSHRCGGAYTEGLPDGCVDMLFSAVNGEPAGLAVVGLMSAPLRCEME